MRSLRRPKWLLIPISTGQVYIYICNILTKDQFDLSALLLRHKSGNLKLRLGPNLMNNYLKQRDQFWLGK